MQDVPRVHARQRVEQLLHDGVHCGLRKSAMPLQELLAVAAGHQIEHDGEILRAMVKAPAAYDARMNAHAQELDLVLKVLQILLHVEPHHLARRRRASFHGLAKVDGRCRALAELLVDGEEAIQRFEDA